MFEFFKAKKWKCSKCGEMYSPSRGELARLEYWGASGESDHQCANAETNNENT